MRNLTDTVWQRRGVSWIWNIKALSSVASDSEISSFRNFMIASDQFPDDLPSNDGRTLVVSGLDASLDVLKPLDAEEWLNRDYKKAILSFQDIFTGDASLIFWVPKGDDRFHIEKITDNVLWNCALPNNQQRIEFGRLLWGDSNGNPQKIKYGGTGEIAGLFHPRIT